MFIDTAPIARLLALGGELHSRRKFDLAHMRTLLQALGNPQQRFPAILIAGTNGKGSTACTLASILQTAGYRVGLYTSPHLETLNERIRIGGTLIADRDLAAFFVQVEEASAQLVAADHLPGAPSFFEAMTAIAFLAFASAPAVEMAVLEVGLGGRLDATNVVDPVLSILTDIALDHMEWLGKTISAITREKAGILRPGGTLITLPQHPEANQVIGEVAVPLNVRAINAADYLPMRAPQADPEPTQDLAAVLRNRYSITLPAGKDGGATLHIDSPLAGSHQQRNIALAIAAAVQLTREHNFHISPAMMEEGIRRTIWPGRLQLVQNSQGPPVLLDAAHNPAGAWALRSALSSLPIAGSRTLVFGCMIDKEITEMAQILFPIFDSIVLTQAKTLRSAPASAMEPAARTVGADYRCIAGVPEALRSALSATPEGGIVVAAGSIALIGECLAALTPRADQHQPQS